MGIFLQVVKLVEPMTPPGAKIVWEGTACYLLLFSYPGVGMRNCICACGL